MKLSLCIPTYNRPEMTIEAFEKVYTDNRIDEIVIVDDNSRIENFVELTERCESLVDRTGINKLLIHCNAINLGMSRNKARAIELAKNDWCILFDSDNILDTDYMDAFYKFVVKSNGDCPITYDKEYYSTIFCPDFAKPDFDYRKYGKFQHDSRGIFYKGNIRRYISEDSFNCLMNTCNYIVNKKFYLDTYQYNKEHIASDTIWHNYNHLKANGIFAVVPDMQYFHRVHKDSGFMQDVNYNMKKAEEVKKLIMQL
jgi:glycosyltransferase involved in cell wall biosynthesis